MYRRLSGRHPLFLDEQVDVLEDDNRIVYDDSDRQGERQHRHRVEREALIPNQSERRDDGRRDRHSRDDRGPPVPQKNEYDRRGQDRADHEVFFHASNGGLDELRQIADNADLVAGGSERRDFCKPFLHGLDDLDGVGAGLPPDRQEDRRLVVQPGFGRRLGHVVLDRRDVAKHDRMRIALAHDDIAKLLHRFNAPPRTQRERRRPLLDPSAGNLRILRLQRARDIGHGQVVGTQPCRVERDVDLAGAPA